MILNDATLLSKNIDGVECSTMREFISKLVKAKDLSMKVYVNSILVCAGPACLNIDNNWVIASTNALVSYTDTVITDSIIVRIMQGDVTLFESVTPCNVIIPAKDTVATFYVCLTSNTPYNELSKRVPHSVFRSRPIAKLTPVEFDKITAGLNPGSGVIVDDGDNHPVTPSIPNVTRINVWPKDDNYVFEVMFDSLSDVSNINYTVKYDYDSDPIRESGVRPNGNNIYFNVPIDDANAKGSIHDILNGTGEGSLILELEIHDIYANPVDTLILSSSAGDQAEWHWFGSEHENG